MAAKIVERSTTAYLVVNVATDTNAKRTFRNINPLATNADLATVIGELGTLQSHQVVNGARTDKYTVMSDE